MQGQEPKGEKGRACSLGAKGEKAAGPIERVVLGLLKRTASPVQERIYKPRTGQER